MTATISGDGTSTLINLTTSGNTVLGDASTDTLNVGNGGLVKDASGNVGIGTTSPGYKLDIQNAGNFSAQLKATSGNYAQWSVVGSAGTSNFGTDSVGGYVQTVGAIPLLFYTQNSERARIDTSGNLLVGTTSNNPASRSASSKFVVVQTSGDTSTLQQSSNSYLNIVSHVSTTSGTRYHIGFGDGTTYGERGVISTNGTGTTYGTASDYRLKENVAPMTGALAVVNQLKPCTYNWKSDGSIGQGFIAHELQAVVPEAVVGEKDAVDAEGNPKYQGIDTSFLVATLTAAIQELKALVDTQASTIITLTDRITALENK